MEIDPIYIDYVIYTKDGRYIHNYVYIYNAAHTHTHTHTD